MERGRGGAHVVNGVSKDFEGILGFVPPESSRDSPGFLVRESVAPYEGSREA